MDTSLIFNTSLDDAIDNLLPMTDEEMREVTETLWGNLSLQERHDEIQAIQQGLADIDAGRTRPADEVYNRIRAKYRFNND